LDSASSPGGLSRAFRAGRVALITYLMAGYPDRETSLRSVWAAIDAGADLIELGVPYGDALADGPVIVSAAHTAMSANPGGFGLAETIGLAAEIVETVGEDCPPLALMTYVNPLLRRGMESVAQEASAAGVSGFIVPDLPPDDPAAIEWHEATRAHGLDTVFLVAPTSTDDRIELVGGSASGFVYCVSSTGVTGERAELPADLAELVRRVRDRTDLPVAVGFGIGTPTVAASVAAIADGVIVGSAIVRRQEHPAEVAELVSLLRAVI